MGATVAEDLLGMIRDSVVEAARKGASPQDVAALLTRMSAYITQTTSIAGKRDWLAFSADMWDDVQKLHEEELPENVVRLRP